jgi:hypothetical protein
MVRAPSEPRFTFLLRRTLGWFPGKFQIMFRGAGNSYSRYPGVDRVEKKHRVAAARKIGKVE